MKYACAVCRSDLAVPAPDADSHCAACGTRYTHGPNYLGYEFDPLLFKRYKRHFLLNKVLNNNGFISYQVLKEGSLSLASRPDVSDFRRYIETHAKSGTLLDVGCGILPLPGYLQFEDTARFELFGLDPIDDRSFHGMRITGCSEFMPFADQQFDTVVYATSLDHVCSLDATIEETRRILKANGKLIIWMGDRSASPWRKFRNWLVTPLRNLVKGYRTDKYSVYPDLTVLYIPDGAVDPFHSYSENPKKIAASLKRAGFGLEDQSQKNRDQVFLSFVKLPSA
ncbi:MAG: methyltransferase domain-containing protein [Burkholderiales bacterium]